MGGPPTVIKCCTGALRAPHDVEVCAAVSAEFERAARTPDAPLKPPRANFVTEPRW